MVVSMNTSRPAFPCEELGIDEHGEYRKPYEGMSLRDYFAAKVLQVACEDHSPEVAAQMAYQYADAMLEAKK